MSFARWTGIWNHRRPSMNTNLANKIRQSNIDVHRQEATIYDAVHPEIFGSFEQSKIARDLELIAMRIHQDTPVRVLDVGCGTGNLTLKYLERNYWVRAVDISPEMIQVLRSKLEPIVFENIDLVVGDAHEVLKDSTRGGWDIISFSSVLHHLPDYKEVLIYAFHQLRPGGVLYVCHEPLRRSRVRSNLPIWILEILLGSIEEIYIFVLKLSVYLAHSFRTGRLLLHINHSWSDYHAKPGIDAPGLLRELEIAGANVLLYETRRNHYLDFLANLDSRLELLRPTEFRFIIQR